MAVFFLVPYFKNVPVGLQDIFAFAERAVAELVVKDLSSIGYDFIYRVDLFEVDVDAPYHHTIMLALLLCYFSTPYE